MLKIGKRWHTNWLRLYFLIINSFLTSFETFTCWISVIISIDGIRKDSQNNDFNTCKYPTNWHIFLTLSLEHDVKRSIFTLWKIPAEFNLQKIFRLHLKNWRRWNYSDEVFHFFSDVFFVELLVSWLTPYIVWTKQCADNSFPLTSPEIALSILCP